MTATRRQTRTAALGAAVGLWIAAIGTSPLVGQDTARSVNDGVYSAAQAARGSAVFQKQCAPCHDTTRFAGADFVGHWSGKPLHALFDTVSTTMPEDAPGALKPQEYGDVIAFILELNQFPAGATELKGSAAAMKTVKMEPLKK